MKAAKEKEEIVRTTVRLPKHLHSRLREAVAASDGRTETLIEAAIENELDARGLGMLEALTEWSPSLAQRFLECLPTPAVIKDSEARIEWCNFAYEDLFQLPRNYVVSKKVTDLHLFDQESSVRLDRDIKAIQRSRNNEAREFWEPLTLMSRRLTLLFRAQRFVFRTSPKRPILLGDISFDCSQILPGHTRPSNHDLPKRLRASAVVNEVRLYFQPFLSVCPAAIAIKDLHGVMVWCNAECQKLAGDQKLSDLVGKDTKTIFHLSETHPVVQNEFTVGHTNVWMYAVEALPEKKPRTSLRFPILGNNGYPAFIAVVSAEFRQDDVHSHRFKQNIRPASKRASNS